MRSMFHTFLWRYDRYMTRLHAHSRVHCNRSPKCRAQLHAYAFVLASRLHYSPMVKVYAAMQENTIVIVCFFFFSLH